MLANTRETYGLIAQALHWSTAILILTLLPLGVYMHELPISSDTELQTKFWYYSLHKTLGVSVLIIAILRVLWAIIQPHPKLLNADKKFESIAAQSVHWLLYGSIILMPLSGWLHHSATEGFAPIWWPFAQDLPLVPKNPQLAEILGSVHYFLAVLLVISLALHIAGALKHAVIDRDGTLARMIPGMKPDIPQEITDSQGSGRFPVIIAIAGFMAVGLVTFIQFAVPHLGHNHSHSHDHASSAATTSAWIVDHEKSTLGIEVIQSGKPVEGSFSNWNAGINFDPDDLANSQVQVEIDIASLALGSVTKQALGSDLLNVATHPTAKFVASEFVSQGNGDFIANGELTLAGVSAPLALPFNLKINEGHAIVEGQAVIKRLDFNVGTKGYSSGQTVGLEVTVLVNLEADQQQ